MPPPMPKDNTLRDVGKYVGLAFLLPISTLVGYGMGYGLDRLFHTKFLTFPFMILGIAAGFIELIKELNQDTGGK